MNENNENDPTHKSEINATMAFTQSLAETRNKRANPNFDKLQLRQTKINPTKVFYKQWLR